MIEHIKHIVGMISKLSTVLFALTGCVTTGVDLSENGVIRIQTQDSEKITFTSVYARGYGDELLVQAEVRPRELVRYFSPGHLRFTMTDTAGKTLWDLDITGYVSGHHGEGISKMKHASFWLRMPMIPPSGSVLTVSHHESEENDVENSENMREP